MICYVCGKTTRGKIAHIYVDGTRMNAHLTCAEDFNDEQRTAQSVTNGRGETLTIPDIYSSGVRLRDNYED